MGNIFEDIVESVGYFRSLRSRKWKEEDIKKNLTNGNVNIINCLYVDDDGLISKKEIKNEVRF